MKIKLVGLPKISLNKFYAGVHWTKRKKLKNDFAYIVKSQYRNVFTKNKKYKIRMDYEFRVRPLDVDNCIGGIGKFVLDILFEDDSPKTILELTATSKKGSKDMLIITVEII